MNLADLIRGHPEKPATDYSKMSDEELRAAYAVTQSPAKSFSAMSDDELKAAYAKATAAPVGLAEDVGKGAVSGLAKGVMHFIGGGGDARETTRDVVGWAAGKLGVSPETAGKVGDAAAWGAKTLMPLLQGPTSQQVKDFAKPVTGDLYEAKTVPGQYASTVAEFVPAALGGPASAVRRVGQVLAPAIASETAGQVAKDTPYEGIARAGGAILGSVVPAAVTRAITPNPISAERQAANAVLQREGVTDLTAGQRTGSGGLRYAESMSGRRAQEIEENQLRQLTEAAVRRIGETGHDAHAAVQRARPRIGDAIDNASQRMAVRLDPRLGDELVQIEQGLMNEGLSPDQVRRILAQRDNILNAFTTRTRGNRQPDSLMAGTALHNLIRTGSPLARATQDADASVAHYANRLRESLMDAAERTATGRGTRAGTGRRQALEDFRTARRQWANMRALEDASSGAGERAAQGVLSPAAVRQAATSRDRSDYARDRGDFAELAKAANMLMAPLPNSGTAQRIASRVPAQLGGMALGGLAGSPLPGVGPYVGAAAGAYLGPKVQSALLMSAPVQRWLANQVIPQGAGNAPSRTQQALIAALLSRPESLPAER